MTHYGETYEEAHRRIQGIFRGISQEMGAGNEISKLTRELKTAEHYETKRYILKKIGEQRDKLYQITGDQKQKKLANNCYKAAQNGFKKFKETREDAKKRVNREWEAMRLRTINELSRLTMDLERAQQEDTKKYIMEKMKEQRLTII